MFQPTLLPALALTLALSSSQCAAPVRDFQVSARVLPFSFRMLARELTGSAGTVMVREGEVLLGDWTLFHWEGRAVVRRQEQDRGR